MLYSDSGVDIGKGDALVEFLKKIITRKKENIGPFSAIIELDFLSNYKNPVLVASTDGIGTKIELALKWNYLEGLGYDLLAMCINDIATCGAKPLFFLDYYATGKLDLEVAKRVLSSLVKACEEFDCPLVGGETAELPGLLSEGKFDIGGFIVGVQEKERIPVPSNVKEGDILIGLPSSGIHSNGYSLVRAIIEKRGFTGKEKLNNEFLRDILLKPTKIYSQIAEKAFSRFSVKGAAHITGGGIPGNLIRCLPDGLTAVIRKDSWEVPEIFCFLKKEGDVPDEEMWKVFNMGLGFIFIVAREDLDSFKRFLNELGEKFYVIGQIEKGISSVRLI
ncbi:MAG: phosphoribosylformylglycinamidine cyclo-ligase [candidate division WOR-3 bacterium]